MLKATRFVFQVPTQRLGQCVGFLVSFGIRRMDVKLISSRHSPSAGTRNVYAISCLVPDKVVKKRGSNFGECVEFFNGTSF
jgi:hypothetical protein